MNIYIPEFALGAISMLVAIIVIAIVADKVKKHRNKDSDK